MVLQAIDNLAVDVIQHKTSMAKSDSYSIDVLLRPDNHEDDRKIKEDNCNPNIKAKALAKKLAGNVCFIYEW